MHHRAAMQQQQSRAGETIEMMFGMEAASDPIRDHREALERPHAIDLNAQRRRQRFDAQFADGQTIDADREPLDQVIRIHRAIAARTGQRRSDLARVEGWIRR